MAVLCDRDNAVISTRIVVENTGICMYVCTIAVCVVVKVAVMSDGSGSS